MFGQRLDVTQTPIQIMPSSNGATPPKRLRTCFLNSVPSKSDESRVTVIGQNAAHEESLVRSLIFDYGWTVGTDFELLPSDTFFRRASA